MVTDFFGNVFRFGTDSTITIETLPKYGRLFTASTAAEAAAAALAMDGNDIGSNTAVFEIGAADGYNRHLGTCRAVGGGDTGDPTRRCPYAFGVGPNLSTRVLGAVAARNRVHASTGGGSRVWYMPKEGYLGPDDFSFSVTVGGVKSTEAWVVGVHTRRYGLVRRGLTKYEGAWGSTTILGKRHLAYTWYSGVCSR